MLLRHVIIALVTLGLLLQAAAGAGAASGERPAFQLHRFDEDYSFLADPSKRGDLFDPLKYLALDASGRSYLSLGGEARERYEYFSNYQWGQGPQTPGGYFLQRYLLHADLHLGEGLRLFSQLKSSLEEGRVGGPRPTDRDELDLHQLFLEGDLAAGARGRLGLRLGRQELSFGSQRLVSVREGPNVRQSFDGVRSFYADDRLRLDAFLTRPANTDPGVLDDSSDTSRALWGLYSVLPFSLAGSGKTDLYYLGLYRGQGRFDQGSAREERHSVGTRLWGRDGGLDYNLELVYQWGSFGDGRIQAWTAASDTGYSFGEVPLKPRLGLKANVASGDRDPASRDLQTFNALFPKGAYFSEASLIGPANFMDLHPSLDLSPGSAISVTLDWDFFWRESSRDGIYGNAVNLVRSGRQSGARYIGSQPQAQLEWRLDRHLSLVAIYAHFLAGPFLRESGPGRDVDYLTSWLHFRF